ncbi:MAG: Carboxypeptidase G2 precursor [Microgenomates bacterium OLB22]|nr:MAG: Carboxypeptidase G2 precursor [Microgenomates bacterium OLB22]
MIAHPERDRHIALLERLIRDDSTSENHAGLQEKARLLRELTQDLPLTWREMPSSRKADALPFYVAESKEVGEGVPRITLSGHIDTILKPDQVPQRIDGDYMYGSGTSDMLGGILVMLETCRKLHESGNLKNIRLAISPEEEIITPNHRETIATLAGETDLVLVYESTSDYEWNADRHVRSVVRSRRGGGKYEIEITGPGGHSGKIIDPLKRHNTNLAAARFISGIEDQLVNYQAGTTCNIGVIGGGHVFNALADKTSMTGDFRCSTPEEFVRITDALPALLNEIIGDSPIQVQKFEFEAAVKPMRLNDADQAFIKILRQAAQQLGISLVLQDRMGVSEANLFRMAQPELAVLDGMGVSGDGEHTPREYASISSIQSAIDFSTGFIREIHHGAER